MALRCGLIGLPGCGKTTIYNAMTSAGAATFDATEAHRATVAVPDPRVAALVRLYSPAKISPSTVEMVDIPGLSEGSTAEGGRGSRLLTHIKEADTLIHVVRCFSSSVGPTTPVHDTEIVDLELMVADAQTLDRKIERIGRRAASGDKVATRETTDCRRVLAALHDGIPARRLDLGEQERASVLECNLLSLKPVLYVANVEKPSELDGADVAALRRVASDERAEVVAVCGREEAEISELEPGERAPFLAELGLAELSIERLIHAAYRELDLVDFFTAGEREVHVWTCRRGDKAPAAAGKIHSDMERGFIRMEVISCDDLLSYGAEAAAAKAGKRRLEGKEYEVQDGDVVVVRFSPPR
jgi:GTP-binding protein YchF